MFLHLLLQIFSSIDSFASVDITTKRRVINRSAIAKEGIAWHPRSAEWRGPSPDRRDQAPGRARCGCRGTRGGLARRSARARRAGRKGRWRKSRECDPQGGDPIHGRRGPPGTFAGSRETFPVVGLRPFPYFSLSASFFQRLTSGRRESPSEAKDSNCLKSARASPLWFK